MSDEKINLSKIDLDRVKREAKLLTKNSDLKYCAALNNIAHSYGFETFENLRSKVMAARLATPQTEPDEPGVEAILTWFRSHFTRIGEVEKRVTSQIAKSLRSYQKASGRSPFHPVDIGEEIDFGYDPQPFKTKRHPQALVAEKLLEAEGEWVSNVWLDSLRIRRGGGWGNGQDDLVGHRITLPLYNEK